MTNSELFKQIFQTDIENIRSLSDEEFLTWMNKKAEMEEDFINRKEALKTLDEHRYSDRFCVEHNIDWSMNLGMAHIVINNLQPLHKRK